MPRHIGILGIFLLFLTVVLADPNRLVSNGTCYYAPGKEADQNYIPCGNAAFGTYACCMNGDTCLSSNACYNGKYGDTTYLAGCTDSSFNDPACGNKGLYSDQQWAGLVRCFVSNDTSSNNEEWAPCTESSQPTVTTPDQGCVCTASANTAVFTDNPTLTALAVLPAAQGLTISWQPGHTPPSDLTPTSEAISSTPTSSSTSTSSSSSESTHSTATTSPTASRTKDSTSTAAVTTSPVLSPTSSPIPNSLSIGAEAGIGVGIGLGVLSICAVLFLLYRRRLHKKQEMAPKYSEVPHISPYTDDRSSWLSPIQGERYASPDYRSPGWSGHKSELPAEGRVTSTLISELSEDRSSVYQPYHSQMFGEKQNRYNDDWRNSASTSLILQEQTIHELPGSIVRPN